MSYSFSFTAASKSEAKERVATELDKVVESQPMHAADREQAAAAADAFIDLVPEPKDDQAIYVSMSGSVSWTGDQDNRNVTGGAVNISASISSKPATA